jgi:tRNA threonylcarbamoyladenosine modification (KEOPS) complex  Pcc1 subunit
MTVPALTVSVADMAAALVGQGQQSSAMLTVDKNSVTIVTEGTDEACGVRIGQSSILRWI